MCAHQPTCPNAEASDHDAARVVACHPEQGWSLLCNGVLVFEDTGELLPNGVVIDPHRPHVRLVLTKPGLRPPSSAQPVVHCPQPHRGHELRLDAIASSLIVSGGV